jgi:tetratricopeptide (TPR) repeat protein
LPGELYRQAAELGQDIVWGQIGPQLLTRLLPQFPDVEILPAQSFYPVHWREAWRLVLAGEYDYCAGAAEGSYAVHWWNEVFRRIGFSKEKFPPKGSFLEQHASDILDGDVDAWPEAMVATWVGNYRNAYMPEMFKQYREGRGDLADILRDLGMEQMKAGRWQKAAEALAAAHHVRPGGAYIRLLLAKSLIALGKPGESEPHLRAALENPATRERATALHQQILGTKNA